MRKRIIFPSCERSSDSKLNCQTLGKIIHKVQQIFLRCHKSPNQAALLYICHARGCQCKIQPRTSLPENTPKKKDVNASITRDGEISIRKSLKPHAGHHQKNGTYSGNVAKFQHTIHWSFCFKNKQNGILE